MRRSTPSWADRETEANDHEGASVDWRRTLVRRVGYSLCKLCDEQTVVTANFGVHGRTVNP